MGQWFFSISKSEIYHLVFKKNKKGVAIILKMSIIIPEGIKLKMRIINFQKGCSLGGEAAGLQEQHREMEGNDE